MDISLILPKQLYVNTRGEIPFDTETYPLAFATNHEENAVGRKRKETVDNWASGYGAVAKGGTVLDNIPLEGYKFDKIVTRWETSNKLFRIFDPRGFALEISAYNLGDILINNSIVNGDLIGKYVWARRSGNIYLINENNELLTKKVDNSKLEVGDKIKSTTLSDAVFQGKFYGTILEHKYMYWDHDENKYVDRYVSPHWSIRLYPNGESMIRVLSIVKDPKPFYVFAMYYDHDKSWRWIALRNPPSKYEKIGTGEVLV